MDAIRSVLIVGSGPIVIGQACEFDYAGTQSVRALKEEGIEVVLINSNPATIMTDNTWADHVYLRPLTRASVEEVLVKHKVDAVLPTMGGQVALNLVMSCEEVGLWKRYGVRIIGVDVGVIATTEDRALFRNKMGLLGVSTPEGSVAKSFLEGKDIAQNMSFPLVLRPSYTLGGTGGGIVREPAHLESALTRALHASPVHEVLVEESIIGWKEFELEILYDRADNFVVVCCIENVDPMGIHTGDSITVAPALTLPDVLYQRMRDTAKHIVRSLKGFAGGCNIQFAVHPEKETLVVIEMNPRVSRSSALASKATGYPIAKIATKLALGFSLDELKNPITGTTSCFFEPTLDYVVVKIPRWNFDKFQEADRQLGLQMKAVGEVMSIGRTFQEALSKAFHGLEVDTEPFWKRKRITFSQSKVLDKLKRPSWDRIFYVLMAFRMGLSTDSIWRATGIDPWFLHQMHELVRTQQRLSQSSLAGLDKALLLRAKQQGYTDEQIAFFADTEEEAVRKKRLAYRIQRSYHSVDTCAAEFEAQTPYYYSSFSFASASSGEASERSPVAKRKTKRRVVILGAGPNRIGQGIEFDYCCVHGALAAREVGFEAIVINCNPETVSTDFDISDTLYFEPVHWEYVRDILDREQPEGVIVQLGGQTALKLAKKLHEHQIPIFGTCYESMDRAEDRTSFSDLLKHHHIPYPPYGIIQDAQSAIELAKKLSFPLLVRPSYVLGGERMKIVINEEELEQHVVQLFNKIPGNRVMLDHFVENATEAEVDALFDGEDLAILGIMQHIEPAGIHSGDSYAILPPYNLGNLIVERIKRHTLTIAKALDIRGLINIQFAIREDEVYVIEANPRASRTTPFICKARQQPYVNYATKIMLQTHKIKDFRFTSQPPGYAIKEPVFSFDKFPRVNKQLGPEMKSTGETIHFIQHLNDPYFLKLYRERNLYLAK